MYALVRPDRGLDDHLLGERHGEVIRVTCSACTLAWDRELSPWSPSCSSIDVRSVRQAVWAESRGPQLSTLALGTVYLCPTCDAETLQVHLNSGSAVPLQENPAGGWE